MSPDALDARWCVPCVISSMAPYPISASRSLARGSDAFDGPIAWRTRFLDASSICRLSSSVAIPMLAGNVLLASDLRYVLRLGEEEHISWKSTRRTGIEDATMVTLGSAWPQMKSSDRRSVNGQIGRLGRTMGTDAHGISLCSARVAILTTLMTPTRPAMMPRLMATATPTFSCRFMSRFQTTCHGSSARTKSTSAEYPVACQFSPSKVS